MHGLKPAGHVVWAKVNLQHVAGAKVHFQLHSHLNVGAKLHLQLHFQHLQLELVHQQTSQPARSGARASCPPRFPMMR